MRIDRIAHPPSRVRRARPAACFPAFLRGFWPEPVPTHYRERLRGAIGVLVGLLLMGILSTMLAGDRHALPLLIAPMGASAILLFSVPGSPMAQPWSICGGNVIAALVGVTARLWIDPPLLAAAIGVAGALGVMSLLRCIHPPGGAVALTAVLGGPQIAALGYGFVAMPVALSSVLLMIAAMLYNHATRMPYPHMPHPPRRSPLGERFQLTDADLDEALTDYGEAIDISRDELRTLFQDLLIRVQRRTGPL